MILKPTKVLHILHAFSHGGLENGIVNIINGSPIELEHELCLLTRGGEFLNRLNRPVKFYELNKQPGNSFKALVQLRRIIRQSRADIVHTRNWGAFDGVIAACLCPGVTVFHGEHGRDMGDPQGLNRRRNLLRRLFSPRIRKFTTVSEDLANWLSGEIGISKEKVVLIRNGVDTERYHPHRDLELRKELGIGQDEFVIGTIGRLDPVKNHAGLLSAYATVAKKGRGIRLVIVGDGPEKKNLENAIRTLDAVTPILTGYRSDIERFYGLFDVFVLNSFAEGMSNTLLEAMSCALPVICTEAGANPELVGDGDRGRLVPAANSEALVAALQEYIGFPERRTAHGRAAHEFIKKNYSLSAMVKNYIDLYLSA
jgi:sugar transferase (PEP-CTERM/EpsH1 system associated)